ncbi:hypothetical protein XM38_001600 [Halomicronema hongdechloris C2206]|uniref:Thylakoid-associated protein n=1 Tax=Halomicronema hongdechloris C2206 TaxID=1641165 RepID=A0A1V8NFK1_9CYAN|nr:DUF3181 family protein [Halomicronema hongdechloris]ASC69234.1 hypothetical protein XM38_001600 [Halomicronema hongdechloris C2206]
MSSYDTAATLEALASEIGDVVYIDVAQWHLYLRDAKVKGTRLHQTLANALYPSLTEGKISADAIAAALKDISVPLGGGRQQLPLGELVPAGCQQDLLRRLEDFQRDL